MTRLPFVPFVTNPYRERAYALRQWRALVGSVETMPDAAWWLRRACAYAAQAA